MKKLRKIISNREWAHNSSPFEVFENRLKDMMDLEVLTISSKISDSTKNEAKKQYLIMLVTCYETYLRETFKKIIEEKLVPFFKIAKLKKLKNIQLSLEELDFIKNQKIEFPEMVCEYINFQNFREMKEAFSIIDLDKKITKKIEEKDNIMPPPKGRILKGKNEAGIVNEFYKDFAAHKKMFNEAGLYSQINLLLEARHKIVHQNINIKIFQEDVMVMTATIHEFIFLLNKVIEEIRKEKSNKKSPNSLSAKFSGKDEVNTKKD